MQESPALPHSHFEYLQQLLAQQQEAHHARPYPDLAARLDLLDRLQRMLDQHSDVFIQTISDDFGYRSAQETRMAELLVVQLEIRHTRRKLARWMKPRRMPTALSYWPASNHLMRQPLGVVGVVSPWNYPLQLALSPALAALAAGNRVMIKPSELTPRFSEALQQAVAKFFATSELVVVPGDAEIGKAFTQLPFDHLLFTGSTAVGRVVAEAAASHLTPVTLELGGKSPAIIDTTADMAHAAHRIAVGKLLNAGQTCVAPDYVLVHRSQHEAFVEAYTAAVHALYPTLGDNPDYTSIISARHFTRLVDLLQDAHDRGARVVPIGETDSGMRKLAPCLVLDAQPEMRVMQEEIFGPILPVLIYDNVDQAIDRVRQCDHPLALYWFGQDRTTQDKILESTLAGGVTINDCLYHLTQESQPFGGVGASGMGAYHGEWGFRAFSKEKPVFTQSRWSGTRWLTPPYGTRFERLMQWLRCWG